MKPTNKQTANTLQSLDPISRHAMRWMQEHEKVVNTILWLQLAAMVWVILNYDFTTHF